MEIITAGDKQLAVCAHCSGSSLCQFSSVVWREELGEKTLRFYCLSCPKCGKGTEQEAPSDLQSPVCSVCTGQKEDDYGLFATLIRWGGLIAVLYAALAVFSDLVALFSLFSHGAAAGFAFRDAVTQYAEALLLVGLVALYGRQFKAVGIPGLVGFLEASAGVVLDPLQLVWPDVLASLGWVLFGAVSLDAEVYAEAALILLVIGAGLSGLANALLVSGLFEGNLLFAAGAMVVDIIFDTAIGWLGIDLFTSKT
jgi:hypothetical protein